MVLFQLKNINPGILYINSHIESYLSWLANNFLLYEILDKSVCLLFQKTDK